MSQHQSSLSVVAAVEDLCKTAGNALLEAKNFLGPSDKEQFSLSQDPVSTLTFSNSNFSFGK